VGSKEDWVVTIEELAEIVLEQTGASRKLAEYKGEEAFTTRVKIVDFSKSRRDLKHEASVDIREGVKRYVQWMKKIYLG
jgi:dTDP-glucose 4,6-dehydratase